MFLLHDRKMSTGSWSTTRWCPHCSEAPLLFRDVFNWLPLPLHANRIARIGKASIVVWILLFGRDSSFEWMSRFRTSVARVSASSWPLQLPKYVFASPNSAIWIFCGNVCIVYLKMYWMHLHCAILILRYCLHIASEVGLVFLYWACQILWQDSQFISLMSLCRNPRDIAFFAVSDLASMIPLCNFLYVRRRSSFSLRSAIWILGLNRIHTCQGVLHSCWPTSRIFWLDLIALWYSYLFGQDLVDKLFISCRAKSATWTWILLIGSQDCSKSI